MLALKARFDPLRSAASSSIVDLERLCLLPTEDMEEHLLLGRLAEQAGERAGESGRQLISQLQWAARTLGLPSLAHALEADTLPSCFIHALRHAEFSVDERLLVLRLVESHSLKFWPDMVQTALTVLDQLGLHAARSVAGTVGNASRDMPPAASAATVQTLREARASLTAGNDALLAQTLLQAITPPLGDGAAGLITALSGAWMDQLTGEPELPSSFIPDLESLRLAVIKAALCDPSFFTQTLHPVRHGIEQLAANAAFIGLQGYSLAGLRRQAREIAERVSIQGQFAADALRMLAPLPPDLSLQFQRQMDKDRETRREALVNRVRALASREIDARTLEVSLPAAARAALTRGFLPLLCTLMLRHGAAAPKMREARHLLDRFVDSFALCISGAERGSVLLLLRTIFTEVGLPAPHAAQVCRELEQAYAELAEEAQYELPQGDSTNVQREINGILLGMGVAQTSHPQPAPPHAANEMPVAPKLPTWTPAVANNDEHSHDGYTDPLDLLLRVGQWFRVRDYQRGDDRWLVLGSVHRDHDSLSFSGFDGQSVMTMKISQLTDDLVSGLAEPLNPSPATLKALQTLQARVLMVTDRIHGFG